MKEEYGLQQVSSIQDILQEVGLVKESEAALAEQSVNYLPNVKIANPKIGTYNFYVDYGDMYDEAGQLIKHSVELTDTLEGIILAVLNCRAMFSEEDNSFPQCASVNGRVVTEKSYQDRSNCNECPQNGIKTDCRGSRRVLLFTDGFGLVWLRISPMSIRLLSNHLKGLAKSKVPFFGIWTKFIAKPTEKQKYRFASVECNFGRYITHEEGVKVKEFMERLEEYVSGEHIDKVDVVNDDDVPF